MRLSGLSVMLSYRRGFVSAHNSDFAIQLLMSFSIALFHDIFLFTELPVPGLAERALRL